MKTSIMIWGVWSVVSIVIPLVQSGVGTPSTSDVWQALIRSIPNIVAFLFLVMMFIRHIESRERSQEELIRNNTRIIEKNTEVVGGALSTMERLERERAERLDNIRRRRDDREP